MAETRRGEKIGWTAGWLGGFAWVAILAAVFLFRHRPLQGAAGLGLAVLALFAVLRFAPWRHPDTPYWKLMLPVYAVLFLAVAWAVWAFGGWGAIGLEWWNLSGFLPLLMPLGAVGRRSWNDPGR